MDRPQAGGYKVYEIALVITGAQSENTLLDKSSVMSWWKRMSRRSPAPAGQRRSDWFFCLILAAVITGGFQQALVLREEVALA